MMLSPPHVSTPSVRWTGVLDPRLALSRHGLALARRLGEVMDLWVVRELWHILDNTHLYLNEPDRLLEPYLHASERATDRTLDHRASDYYTASDHPSRLATREDYAPTLSAPGDRADSARGQAIAREELTRALQEWERVRLETDLAGMKLFWVGDGLGESLLPAGTPTGLVPRFEAFARGIDVQLGSSPGLGPAFRDAAALAAALGVPVLTLQGSDETLPDLPPALCSALDSAGIPCHRLPDHDPLVQIEQDLLRRLIVQTGSARLVWSGLRLAMVHLVVPSTLGPLEAATAREDPDLGALEELIEEPEPEVERWTGSQAFWYRI